ncbi:superoxide dismutase [Solihabitans fulvus]|uniref:Superoxide dismutase n=1 Tax=Solihabitans fulvus TaxID=1892852 RepID=A0A5B2XED2_9PSEU|nr:superoxide dismutase [Solihabitans fulvus]KAA2261596.1 superoxide dismutase [Solihabitans fulvus]
MSRLTRVIAVASAVSAIVLAAIPTASADPANPSPALVAGHRPNTWALPGDHAAPEGIARDPYAPYFYTGSTADGTIYRGDLRTGEVRSFLPGGVDGRATAVGMKVDRFGRLIIAGGYTGLVWVYDTGTGSLLHTFDTGISPNFLNDLAVADDGDVYVTDSVQPKLYRIAAEQLDSDAPRTAALPVFADLTGSPIVYRDGFNLNGIVVTPDQRYVIVAHDNDNGLFRIDRRSKEIRRIDLGGAGVDGDGLLIRGHTLYAVSSVDGNRSVVNVVRLDWGYGTGVLERRATNPLLDRPSTAAFDGDAILVVNFQYAVPNPHLPYTVVRVPLADLT